MTRRTVDGHAKGSVSDGDSTVETGTIGAAVSSADNTTTRAEVPAHSTTMRRQIGPAIVLVTSLVAGLLAGCSPATGGGNASAVVDQAAAALGGRDRLLTVRSVIAEGAGTNGNLGQDVTPEATGQTFAISDYRRVHSFSANALRIEQTRTPNFPYFLCLSANQLFSFHVHSSNLSRCFTTIFLR